MTLQRFCLTVLSCFLLLGQAGCGGSIDVPREVRRFVEDINPVVEYSPPLPIPVTFIVSARGIDVATGAAFVTPIGVFRIGASKPLISAGRDDLVLVLRELASGNESVYRIKGGQTARIVIEGRTHMEITTKVVTINVTSGQIIQVLPIDPPRSVGCPSIEISQLAVGMQVIVEEYWVNMRSSPEVPSDWGANVINKYAKGTLLTVVDGPACAHGGYWWKVQARDGSIGWMREEVSDARLLRPY